MDAEAVKAAEAEMEHHSFEMESCSVETDEVTGETESIVKFTDPAVQAQLDDRKEHIN